MIENNEANANTLTNEEQEFENEMVGAEGQDESGCGGEGEDEEDEGGDISGLLAMLRGDKPNGPQGFSIQLFETKVADALQTVLGDMTDETIGGKNVGAIIESQADLVGNLAADHDLKAGAEPGTSLKLAIDTLTESYNDFVKNGAPSNEKVAGDLAAFG